MIFALLVVHYEVATSASILPWGARILQFDMGYIIFDLLVVQYVVATSV